MPYELRVTRIAARSADISELGETILLQNMTDGTDGELVQMAIVQVPFDPEQDFDPAFNIRNDKSEAYDATESAKELAGPNWKQPEPPTPEELADLNRPDPFDPM